MSQFTLIHLLFLCADKRVCRDIFTIQGTLLYQVTKHMGYAYRSTKIDLLKTDILC